MSHVVTVGAPPWPTRPPAGAPPLWVEAVPAARDNLVWIVSSGRRAVVVDGPANTGVAAHLAARGLELEGILVTHTHADHVGILADFPEAPFVGPALAAADLPRPAARLVDGGDAFELLGAEVRVLRTEGHLHGHVSYLVHDVVFCGDTLFAGGCGRAFQDPSRLWDSLVALAALPPETRVCCAHEYTLGNYAFARSVLPDDAAIAARAAEVAATRAEGRSVVPSTIGEELATNVFLRARTREEFTALRARKDTFKG